MARTAVWGSSRTDLGAVAGGEHHPVGLEAEAHLLLPLVAVEPPAAAGPPDGTHRGVGEQPHRRGGPAHAPLVQQPVDGPNGAGVDALVEEVLSGQQPLPVEGGSAWK